MQRVLIVWLCTLANSDLMACVYAFSHNTMVMCYAAVGVRVRVCVCTFSIFGCKMTENDAVSHSMHKIAKNVCFSQLH